MRSRFWSRPSTGQAHACRRAIRSLSAPYPLSILRSLSAYTTTRHSACMPARYPLAIRSISALYPLTLLLGTAHACRRAIRSLSALYPITLLLGTAHACMQALSALYRTIRTHSKTHYPHALLGALSALSALSARPGALDRVGPVRIHH